MLTEADLGNFNGTDGYTRLGFPFRNVVLTDGALHVAEHGGTNGAFWLMQAVASHLPAVLRKGGERACFQLWRLSVHEDKSALLTCQLDTGEPLLAQQRIEYTDFDVPDFKLYVGQQPSENGTLWVIMLPSEY